MLTPKEGSPKALQKLFRDHLLPPLLAAPPEKVRLVNVNPSQAGFPCPPDLPGHQHFFAEVCLCLAGEAEFWAAGTVQRLGQGEALVIPPGVFHSAASLHAVTIPVADAFSRLVWMSLLPYGCVINLCETSKGSHSTTPRQLMVERHVNRSFQEMILELRSGAPYAATMAKCRLLEAIIWICRGDERQWTASGPPAPDVQTHVPEEKQSVAGRCRAFIEAHFDRSLDLDSIAQAVCTNKSNLCRVFRNETGITVGEYLTRTRIDAAKRLLLTSLTVSAVARLVGFEDPYYFSRVFRRAMASSPSEFRARMEAKCHTAGDSVRTADLL